MTVPEQLIASPLGPVSDRPEQYPLAVIETRPIQYPVLVYRELKLWQIPETESSAFKSALHNNEADGKVPA